MAVELEGLEFRIETSSDGAIRHLNDLSDSLQKLRNASSNLRGLGTATQRIKDLFSSIPEDKINALDRLSTTLVALKNASDIKISSTVASRISDIGTAARNLREEDVDRLVRLGDALHSLGDVGRINIPRIRVPAEVPTTSSGGERNIEGVDVAATRATTRVEELRASLGSIGSSFTTGFSNIVGELKHLATSSDKASVALRGLAKYTVLLPVTLGSRLASSVRQSVASLGHLLSAIKRIALYRAIRTVLREITQGLKEGVNNIYQYSQALNGEFAGAMDSLATSSQYLRNSLGAVAAPILQSLAPAINYAVDCIVGLLNAINMLIAALGGSATYTVARRFQTSFGSAASGTSAAMKSMTAPLKKAAGDATAAADTVKESVDKIKSYTIGIDELNILEEVRSKSGGSGGAGGGAVGGAGGAGGIDPSSMFEQIPIDAAIGSFAQQIRDAFNSKDWQTLGELFGNKFNELVGSVNWEQLGTNLGKGLNGVIETAYSALKTADFHFFGEKISTAVNNTLNEINFEHFGGLLVMRITKPLDFVIGFLQKVEGPVYGKSIGDFFVGVFDEATNWINSYKWDDVSREITNNICDVILNIDWMRVLASVGNLQFSFDKMLMELIRGFFTPEPGSATQKIMDWLSPASWLGRLSGLGADVSNVIGNIGRSGELFGPGGGLGSVKAIEPITLTFKGELENDSSTWWSNAKQWWSEKVGSVDPFKTNTKNESGNWWSNTRSWWSGVVGLADPFGTDVRDESNTWWGHTKGFWNGVVGAVSDFRTGVRNESTTWWGNVKRWWDEKIVQPVSSFRTNVQNDAATWWSNVKLWWSGVASKLSFSIGVRNEASTWWSNVKSWWNGVAGSLTTKLHINIPRVTVTWGKDPIFHTIDVPSFHVQWNAKGAILKGAQLFGMLGNELLGGGEAGAEALLPLEQNTGWMDTIAEKVRDVIGNSTVDDSGNVARILERLDAIEARLQGIGDDTRRQADKPENTYVNIGGKALRDAVVRQAKADGFSFT